MATPLGRYRESVALLKKAGAGHPPGRIYHAAFGPADNVKVFDVWTSQAAFEKFGRTLLPILQQVGIDGAPEVMAIQNIIRPPARKSRPVAKKAAPARRAAAKKSKARRASGKTR